MAKVCEADGTQSERPTTLIVTLLGMLRDQRGVALFSAVIAMMVLSALVIAFTVLAKSEPTIATNHLWAIQARVLAESGVERAIWWLDSNPANPSTAPYDGSAYLPVGTTGGFFVTITNGAAPNEQVVDAVGWYPTSSATALQTAHRHIHLKVTRVKYVGSPPPAALTVEGEVHTQGSAVTISAAADTSCGNKDGVIASGTITSNGSPTIQGGGGAPGELQNAPTSVMDPYMLTNTDLNALKSLAMANGTYFKGSQTFNSSNPWPTSGLVFIDTTSGNNLNCTPPGPGQHCTNPNSDNITVSISGTGGMPPLNGWLIVNGSINWSGNATVNGLVYAVNDIAMSGTPIVNGAVISKNIIDTSSTSVDSTFAGTPTINYNCANAKNGGGTIPTGWFIEPGTYREVSD